jgi:hypothetical protein
LVPGTVKHQLYKKKINRDQEGCRLDLKRLLMTVNNYTGKCASGMDKFGSVVDRMYMKLGSKFLSSLRVKTQLLKRLQCVTVADGATHSQKDGVEGNGGSFKEGAEAFMLFLRGAQLVLRSQST